MRTSGDIIERLRVRIYPRVQEAQDGFAGGQEVVVDQGYDAGEDRGCAGYADPIPPRPPERSPPPPREKEEH